MGFRRFQRANNLPRALGAIVFFAIFASMSFAATIEWTTDYKAGIAKAKEAKKPVLIDFTAEWCGWCKRLDEEVYSDNAVAAALKDFVCLKVDVDKQPNVALAYGVQSMPRTIAINVNNEVVGDLNGYVPLGSFLEFLHGLKDDLNRKTGGTAVPEVKDNKSPDSEKKIEKPTADMSANDLVALLGDADKDMRKNAANAILQKPEHNKIFVVALGSELLGTRIMALDVLKNQDAPNLKFDPWAPKADRDAALPAWREWAEKKSTASDEQPGQSNK